MDTSLPTLTISGTNNNSVAAIAWGLRLARLPVATCLPCNSQTGVSLTVGVRNPIKFDEPSLLFAFLTELLPSTNTIFGSTTESRFSARALLRDIERAGNPQTEESSKLIVDRLIQQVRRTAETMIFWRREKPESSRLRTRLHDLLAITYLSHPATRESLAARDAFNVAALAQYYIELEAVDHDIRANPTWCPAQVVDMFRKLESQLDEFRKNSSNTLLDAAHSDDTKFANVAQRLDIPRQAAVPNTPLLIVSEFDLVAVSQKVLAPRAYRRRDSALAR